MSLLGLGFRLKHKIQEKYGYQIAIAYIPNLYDKLQCTSTKRKQLISTHAISAMANEILNIDSPGHPYPWWAQRKTNIESDRNPKSPSWSAIYVTLAGTTEHHIWLFCFEKLDDSYDSNNIFYLLHSLSLNVSMFCHLRTTTSTSILIPPRKVAS